MCGIFGSLSNHPEEIIHTVLDNISPRGPDKKSMFVHKWFTLGFTRLAINGLQDGDQPIQIESSGKLNKHGKYSLVCNGEIYNHRELAEQLGITPQTGSDCEIILHLYLRYGMETTLQHIHGVYAFILCDMEKQSIYVARDPFGVRPLYYQDTLFCSEIKGLVPFHHNTSAIEPFPAGTCNEYRLIEYYDNHKWVLMNTIQHYQLPPSVQSMSDTPYFQIVNTLYEAVKRRVHNTEQPVACLLSGGLDSSLISAMTSHILNSEGKKLQTFSIGMEGGEDLQYARMVAEHIGSNHSEIILTEQDFLDAIPHVIYATETYDTTTVRASVGNYLIAKYIRENTDCKVILNGDGSDEVCGGYMYFHFAPDSIAFDKECRRLILDIHRYDVLRSDRSVASHGLEARTPFLDREFVSYYLSIPAHLRNHCIGRKCEKYLLRKSFEEEWSYLLPKEVLWRTKEAFSDGVSKTTRSWYEIIQEYAQSLRSIYDFDKTSVLTMEQQWYKMIWSKYFPSNAIPITYYWMPRFIEATDASARTLPLWKLKN